MANDSALSTPEVTPESVAASLALIPDDVVNEPLAPEQGTANIPPPVVPALDPWAATNVEWLVPLAGKLIQLPYEQVAKRTHDECWIVTDEQIAIINPALENALKWTVWRCGAANTIGHPLVAFGVALASLTAVKYGIYQFNQSQRKEGGPQKQPPQARTSTPMDTTTTSGKTAGSGGVSSSAASQPAANPTSSRKEFVLADE